MLMGNIYIYVYMYIHMENSTPKLEMEDFIESEVGS